MQQHDPSPTPFTGNAVITSAVIAAFVVSLIKLLRAYGHDVTGDQENAIVEFIQGPFGDVLAYGVGAVATWYASTRVYSELSVKKLTGQERPPV
jgi:uncharacterized protein (DUF697 family)